MWRVAGDFGRDRRDVASSELHPPTSSQGLLDKHAVASAICYAAPQIVVLVCGGGGFFRNAAELNQWRSTDHEPLCGRALHRRPGCGIGKRGHNVSRPLY